MAAFATNRKHAKRAAILSDKSSQYSQQLASNFEYWFNKLGGQIIVHVGYTKDDHSFIPQLREIRAAKADKINLDFVDKYRRRYYAPP
jgi:branched-chain amino acid transport system substrate-binding protein